jgi:hypothetical protein
MTSNTTKSPDDERFDKLVLAAYQIRENFVRPNLEWYKKHKWWPLLFFRVAGIITIVLGVSLPAVAAIEFTYKNIILSLMSVTIAALTGLSSFFRWERTWRGRVLSQSAVDGLLAKWELEIENARLILDDAHERRQHVYRATNDLISNFRNVSATETEEFFGGMQFPQSDNTSKDA